MSEKTYRPDVDGLRAVAVLGVLFFHAGLGFPGGFAGVDVFFVISGFLITGIVLKDLENGSFSMVSFWERRVRRIFPALFVTVVVSIFAGWFVLLPFGYLVLAQSAIAQSLFASNIQFWRTTDYFSPRAEENPLLHTWSLSVEEQFYLIIPLLLAGLYAWRRHRYLWPVLLLITLASFCVSIFWMRQEPEGAFYLLPGRAWELGIGALTVFAPPITSSFWRQAVGWIGLTAILQTFFFYQPSTPFPGAAALPSVLGTAMVIWSGSLTSDSTPLRLQRMLACYPFVWCGLMSYSLYLWHWPFFAFHRYIFGHAPSPAVSWGYILAAFILGALSLHFIERPFRQKRICSSRKAIFAFFLAGTSAVVVVSLIIYLAGGLAFRIPAEALRFDQVEGNVGFVGKRQQIPASGTALHEIGVPEKVPQVLLWGDSHAEVLLSAMDEICRQLGVAGSAVIRGGTPPIFGWSGQPDTTREHARAMATSRVVEEMLKTGSYRVVVLAFRWSFYLRRDPPLDPSRVPLAGFDEALNETIGLLHKTGVKVILLEEVPIFPLHVARSAALSRWIGVPEPSLKTAEVETSRQPYEPILQRLKFANPEMELMDPAPLFIRNEQIEFMDVQGFLLWRDEHHLTRRGAERLIVPMREKLLRALTE